MPKQRDANGPKSDIDYDLFKRKQGTKFIQQFKKIFPGNKQIDKAPENFLARFLTQYYKMLEAIYKELEQDSDIKSRMTIANIQKSRAQQEIENLGRAGNSGARRSLRMTISATDEKIILEKERKKIH